MTLPSDIPEAVAERAAILMDTHRNVSDDLEYTARIIMAVEAEQHAEPFGLSKKQADVRAFIETFIDEHGYSPSYAEICGGMGLGSRSKAHSLVHQLVERGALRVLPGRSRTLSIVERA